MKVHQLNLPLASVVVALLAGCSDGATGTVSQLNLDRPVDIAFACYGGMRVLGADNAAQPTDPVV
jgi:hypothetical protein